MHLEGPALSAYVSFVRKNYWSSLLYSFGTYDMSTMRNPGFGFAGAGFQTGPAVGEVLAELVHAGASSTLIDAFSISRFSRVPPPATST